MEHTKSSSKRETYSNTGLPQERRKKSNKQCNLPQKVIIKGRNANECPTLIITVITIMTKKKTKLEKKKGSKKRRYSYSQISVKFQ